MLKFTMYEIWAGGKNERIKTIIRRGNEGILHCRKYGKYGRNTIEYKNSRKSAIMGIS